MTRAGTCYINTRKYLRVISKLETRSLHHIALHFISVKVHFMNGLRVHSNVLIGIALAINMVRVWRGVPRRRLWCARELGVLPSCCLWDMKMEPDAFSFMHCKLNSDFHPTWCYCNDYWSFDQVFVWTAMYEIVRLWYLSVMLHAELIMGSWN